MWSKLSHTSACIYVAVSVETAVFMANLNFILFKWSHSLWGQVLSCDHKLMLMAVRYVSYSQ